MTLTCPRCHARVSSRGETCPACGTPLFGAPPSPRATRRARGASARQGGSPSGGGRRIQRGGPSKWIPNSDTRVPSTPRARERAEAAPAPASGLKSFSLTSAPPPRYRQLPPVSSGPGPSEPQDEQTATATVTQPVDTTEVEAGARRRQPARQGTTPNGHRQPGSTNGSRPAPRPQAAKAKRKAGTRPSPRRARRRVTRAPWYRRWRIMVPLVLVALLLSSVGGSAWYLSSKFDDLDEISTPPPQVSLGEPGDGSNNVVVDTTAAREHVAAVQASPVVDSALPDRWVSILVMGVDARPGEPIDVKVRADSLAVVVLDRDDGSCRLLSVPRDTRLNMPGYGNTKMNSALAVGGIPFQKLMVEDLLGIKIDHYGLIDFSGAEQLVDSIGRVVVVNDEEFEIDGITYSEGTLALNGHEALMYARYRGGPEGEYGRQKRQQQVARALLSRAASLDVVTAVPGLLDAVEGHVRTDLDLSDMIDIGQEFRSSCNADTLDTALLDGVLSREYDDIMEMELDFVILDQEEIDRKVDWLLQ